MLKKYSAGKMLLLGSVLAASSSQVLAGGKIAIDDTRWISVGVGLRTSIAQVGDAAPNGSDANNFNLENARVYLSGQATKDFKFYLGTEKMFGEYGILDAIIQYEPSKKFNVWMGRMLVPADRIEMNGPFYGLSWNQYTVPLYPSDNDINNDANGVAGTYGRDEGVTVWGTVGKLQYAVGIFDGFSGDENQSDDMLFATRLAYNFLENESNPGYYTSSTYYGKAGDILTLAVSAQSQSGGYGSVTQPGEFKGYAVDAFLEKTLSNGAVLNVDAELKSFDVSTAAATPALPMFDGDASFATVAYLLPGDGAGQYQPYVRITNNSPTGASSSSLTEVGVNYVISGHNLRLNFNITNGDANASGAKAAEESTSILLGMQIQI